MKESLEEKVKRLEAENEAFKNEKKKNNRAYLVIGVVVGLSYWGAYLYRKTMIDIKFLLGIILFAGIIGFLIERLGYCFTDRKRTNIFLALFKNIFSWGLIVCSLFLVLNYYIYFNKVETTKYELGRVDVYREKGSLRSVFFNIEHEKKVKKIKFSPKYYRDRFKYKSVSLDMTTGLFGFEIIKKQELNY